MKLCFVSNGQWSVDVLRGDTSAAGGAEAQTAYLAQAFANLGHSVNLIYGSGESVIKEHNIAGLRCVNAFPSWNRPVSLCAFWQALRQSDPDLIYSRLPHDFLWLEGLFAKRSTHTTFVYALANDLQCNPWSSYESAGRKSYFHNTLYAWGLRLADAVAVQHDVQAQLVKPYIKGKLVKIPNLVRFVASNPRPYDKTTTDVIWVSHIHPRKQLSILLDIATQLPTLRFLVIGGFGPEPNRNELESRMREITNLRFDGPRPFDDVMQLLMSSKVLVNTSSWEGFPNTMLEAWSVGVPVVSLQIDPGGIISREGIGVVSGTSSQMACDILKLVDDASLNCVMGKKGQEYVRRAHGIDAVCDAFNQAVPGFHGRHLVVREGHG